MGAVVSNCPQIIWITGLSGAGQTSLANELVRRLREQGEPVMMLDGDELREVFGAAAANTRNHGRNKVSWLYRGTLKLDRDATLDDAVRINLLAEVNLDN